MPSFVWVGHDAPESAEVRKRHRPAHLEALEGLEAAGRIHFAGPLLGEDEQPVGSVVVVGAPDLDAARGIVERDPYVTEGVFERYEVHAARRVFPRA